MDIELLVHRREVPEEAPSQSGGWGFGGKGLVVVRTC
jgi:hypothetical protein